MKYNTAMTLGLYPIFFFEDQSCAILFGATDAMIAKNGILPYHLPTKDLIPMPKDINKHIYNEEGTNLDKTFLIGYELHIYFANKIGYCLDTCKTLTEEEVYNAYWNSEAEFYEINDIFWTNNWES